MTPPTDEARAPMRRWVWVASAALPFLVLLAVIVWTVAALVVIEKAGL